MIRRFSLFITACMILLFTTTSAMATISATDTIRQRVDDILNIVKNPDMNDPTKRPPLLQLVEDHVKTIFDFTEFSARTVGPKWRQFTPDQQKRFENAFASLLRATYIEKLDGYNGEKVNFLGEVASTKGDKVEVQSTVMMKDKEVPVSYRLLNQSGSWKVYDVRIEKVSLIENYRGQFKEILLKGNAEDLISKVEAKAAEVKQENEKTK